MAADLTKLSDDELKGRVDSLQADMRPLEGKLGELRAERDVLLTELRRRERLAQREQRAGVKEAIKSGRLLTLAELLQGDADGSFEGFHYNLKTGGEVRLGFPGARTQAITWTDGRQVMQARDFDESRRLYEAGWQLGAPGKPGVRVHFPGTRLERLVDAEEVFATPA